MEIETPQPIRKPRFTCAKCPKWIHCNWCSIYIKEKKPNTPMCEYGRKLRHQEESREWMRDHKKETNE